jgi:hypothetical protein
MKKYINTKKIWLGLRAYNGNRKIDKRSSELSANREDRFRKNEEEIELTEQTTD